MCSVHIRKLWPNLNLQFQKSKHFGKILMVVGYSLVKSNGSLFTEDRKLQGEIVISQERDFDGF